MHCSTRAQSLNQTDVCACAGMRARGEPRGREALPGGRQPHVRFIALGGVARHPRAPGRTDERARGAGVQGEAACGAVREAARMGRLGQSSRHGTASDRDVQRADAAMLNTK